MAINSESNSEDVLENNIKYDESKSITKYIQLSNSDNESVINDRDNSADESERILQNEENSIL